MRRAASLVLAIGVAFGGCVAPQAATTRATRRESGPPPAIPTSDPAYGAIDALIANDWPAVVDAFEVDSDRPTSSQVEAAWHDHSATLGEPHAWTLVDRTYQDGLEVRIVRIELDHGTIQCLLSVDLDSRKLRSLFITRPAPPATYVDRSRFHEVDVRVGSPPFELGATLTLPNGSGPFPAAVLVHGSGPNDRDASVGATKILRDIAHGLASSGIAVLRYDKRTYTYRDTLSNNISIEDEAIHDALAAVDVLAAHPDIEHAGIFVIGHSLGGLLAPEIAVRAGNVAGLALLAPPGRPPWEIVREQMRYLGASREVLTKTETAVIELSLGVEQGSLIGMPYSYWRDWASRDGVAMVKRFARPTLVLHGTRDYQVTSADFATWRDGLANESYVDLATISGVNHLFIAGNGPPNPHEYKIDNHVDPRVITKLVELVRRSAASGTPGAPRSTAETARPARSRARPSRASASDRD